MVVIETNDNGNRNIGKLSYMKIAKDIYEMKLSDVVRIKNKGNHEIGVEFSSYVAANLFVNNSRLLDKYYNIYIPYNMVTCKDIVRRVDPDLTINEIKCMMGSVFKVIDIKR